MSVFINYPLTQPAMPRFELKQSTRHITSYAGLILVGQCLEAARLDLLDNYTHWVLTLAYQPEMKAF